MSDDSVGSGDTDAAIGPSQTREPKDDRKAPPRRVDSSSASRAIHATNAREVYEEVRRRLERLGYVWD
jgi:hypothetical protein